LGATSIKIWGPENPNFGQFFKLPVHCSRMDKDIANSIPDYSTRDIPLPDNEKMVYFGLPRITWSQLIRTHPAICFTVFSQSDSLDGTIYMEVYWLNEARRVNLLVFGLPLGLAKNHFKLDTFLHPIMIFFCSTWPYIATCFAVVSKLCHLILVSLLTLYLELYLVG